MNIFGLLAGHWRQQRFRLAALVLVLAVVVGVRVGFDWNEAGSVIRAGANERTDGHVPKIISEPHTGDKLGSSGGVDVTAASHRQPLQFRAKVVEPEAVIGVLASGKQTVDERVRQLQGLRGISLSKDEREAALAFLAGKDWPDGMGKGSAHWLADELLSLLRLQEPPWDGLAAALGEVAFQPNTDPVLRDYIMQHLGHLWEQYGSREEIEQALWRAVSTSDTTTPGTALIALSRGYGRDQQAGRLGDVRQRAFELARNPEIPLAVRVTALSIAGDGGGKDVTALAQDLARAANTPVILRVVAARIVR